MDLKNIILGIAIVILTIFVTVYGINTFYERPEYTDFCGKFKTAEVIDNQERCEEIGGQWNGDGIPRSIDDKGVIGFCDRDYSCRQELDEAREKYSKKVFLIAVPLGIIILALGAFLFSLESVGAGLMGGGIGTLIYGVGNFWNYADNWLRFLISLIGLVALIILAYWFNSKNWNIWKKKGKGKLWK